MICLFALFSHVSVKNIRSVSVSSRNWLSVSSLFLIDLVFALAIVGRCVALARFRLLFFSSKLDFGLFIFPCSWC